MIHGAMMQRRFFLVAASTLPLAGCGGNVLGLGPPEAGALYPVRPTFPAGSGAKVSWALSLLRPDVPPGLNGDRIALIQPDGSMDYYAKATYPDRLPVLVQQALLDGFESSGRIGAVAPEQAALHAEYDLVTEVKDFGAHYTELNGIPQVKVTLTCKLATSHGRAIVSSFTSSQSLTASANSASAVTQAMQQELGTAIGEIVNWALAAPMPVTQMPVTASPGKPAEQLLHDATKGSEALRPQAPR